MLPDLTFIFDISDDIIEKRLASRKSKKEFFEDLEFLKKVKKKYLETYEKLKGERNIFLIDANGTIEEVFEDLKKLFEI